MRNAPTSFDGIWADFSIDPCHGFDVLEASAFVRLGNTPDHEVKYDLTGAGADPRLTWPDIETVALRDLDHPGRQQGSSLLVPRVTRDERPATDDRRP